MGVCASKSSKLSTDSLGEPIVSTKCGMVSGKVIDCGAQKANAFLGIPFARPPLSELRFRRPLPPVPWTGVRSAKKMPPQCPQSLLVKLPGAVPMSEDCLYLNVFAPAERKASPLPVLVFIHGGAFVLGSTAFYGDTGICKNFVVGQEVVVVTIQYRLGPLGFFTTGDEECDDNCGLWDQTMALQWVQENIAEFGGDRDCVTIFGESAGGASVDLLSLSPHSRDLFQRVIPMSGVANSGWAVHDDAVDTCREIAHKLGILTNDSKKRIELLRAVPASKLTLPMVGGTNAPLGSFKCPLAPRYDGKFFPRPLEELRKEVAPKPRMVGVCQLEGTFFVILCHIKQFSLSMLEGMIAREFPEKKYTRNFKELRAEVLKLYLKGEGDSERFRKDKHRLARAVHEILSDLFVGISTQQCVNEQIELGGTTYLYSFDFCNPKIIAMMSLIFRQRVPIKDCTHSCELPYLFDNFGGFVKFLKNETDQKMMQTTSRLWANFAKYGNPNGPDESAEFQWEPVSAERPTRHLAIKPEPEMREHFQEGRPKRWLELLEAKGK